MDIFLTGVFGADAALELARAAESHGLGGVWLAEHPHDRYGCFGDAIVAAQRFLAATTRLTVGTAACVFGHHDPAALAAKVRDLGDRFRLGVARGPGDPAAFERWLRRLDIPCRVATTSPGTAALAARFGLPMQLGVEKTDAEVAEFAALWSSVAGHTGAAHTRLLVPTPLNRTWLAQWLSLKASRRDWTPHIDRLDGIHPVRAVGVPGRMWMVEATGSIGAAARFIESLASSNDGARAVGG